MTGKIHFKVVFTPILHLPVHIKLNALLYLSVTKFAT